MGGHGGRRSLRLERAQHLRGKLGRAQRLHHRQRSRFTGGSLEERTAAHQLRELRGVGDAIISGYGFTAEDDFIYILNRHTGRTIERVPVSTAPDFLCAAGDSSTCAATTPTWSIRSGRGRETRRWFEACDRRYRGRETMAPARAGRRRVIGKPTPAAGDSRRYRRRRIRTIHR